MATITLDLAGLKCPLPALRTRKALAAVRIGDRVEIYCTDPMAAIDIPNLVKQTHNRLIETWRDESGISFLIEKESI